MKSIKILCIVMAAALILSGCSAHKEIQVTTGTSVTAVSSETATETTEEQKFEFNPHLYSAKIAERIPNEYWESLHNLCDALRKGETSFKCQSAEAYSWCTSTYVLCNLFPTAGGKITAGSEDGSPAYENGIGKIKYDMPVEDFLKRQSEFETWITDILNSTIEKNDSEYEEALKLYLYIANNYIYDANTDYEDNFVYRTFKEKRGMCVNFASTYAYLLLQSGIDAFSVSCFESNMCHSWTYAVINGNGYYIDSTWAIKEEYEGKSIIYLDYFMMSEQDRIEDGCPPAKKLSVQLIPEFDLKDSTLTLTATDKRYNVRNYCKFESLDDKNKVLRYTDLNDGIHEFHYEDVK